MSASFDFVRIDAIQSIPKFTTIFGEAQMSFSVNGREMSGPILLKHFNIFFLLAGVSFFAHGSVAGNEEIAAGLEKIFKKSLRKQILSQNQVRHRYKKRWYRTTYYYSPKSKFKLRAFLLKGRDPQGCVYHWLIGMDQKKAILVDAQPIKDTCQAMGQGSRRAWLLREIQGKSKTSIHSEVDWGLVRKLYPMWSEVLERALGRSFAALMTLKKKKR